MAVWTVKSQNELSRFFVLAPERYDPRREATGHFANSSSVMLGQIAGIVRQTLTPSAAKDGSYLVLDTSHAQEGVITSPKSIIDEKGIGSAKKVLGRNDVIISRLRPYLRQVAFVDSDIKGWSNNVNLLCSTEFFILRSVDSQSIAFLVPFLLSPFVQQILAASQEGGHHPRFDGNTLLTLPLPESLLKKRVEISNSVIESVNLYRSSEKILSKLISDVINDTNITRH
jgi:hypothetical protein